MLAIDRWKNAAQRVTPVWLLTLAAVVCGCVDNRNDVGYELLASTGGSSSGTGAGGSTSVSGSAAATTLPPLPRLTGVQASVSGDSVSISFEPLADAVDYRVYALPQNQDISTAPNGDITIRNVVYRCAGNREVPPIALDRIALPSMR